MANPSASGQGIVHNIGKYFMMLLVIAYIFTNSAIAYNDAHGNFKNIEWARIIYPNYVRNIVTDVSSSFSSDNGAVSTDTEPGDTASGNNPIIDSVIKNQNQDSTPTPKTEDKTNPTGNTNPTAPESSGEESSGWSAWKWILVVGIIVITFGTLTGSGLLYFKSRKIKPKKESEGKELTYKEILDMKCVIANGKERTVRQIIKFFYASLKDVQSKDLTIDKIKEIFDKLKSKLSESDDNKTFELKFSIVMTTSRLLNIFFSFIIDLISTEGLNITSGELIFNLVKVYEREVSANANNAQQTEDASTNADNSAKIPEDEKLPKKPVDLGEEMEEAKIISEDKEFSKGSFDDSKSTISEHKELKKELIDEKYVYSQLLVKYANLLSEDEKTINRYAIEIVREIITEFDVAAKKIGFDTTLFRQIYETNDIKILESNLRDVFKMKKHTRDVLIAVLGKKREELLSSKTPSMVLVYGIIEELKKHGKELDKSLEEKLKESISAASTLQKITKSWITLNRVILRKNTEAQNIVKKCIEKISHLSLDRYSNEEKEKVSENKAYLENELSLIEELEKYFEDEIVSIEQVNKIIIAIKHDIEEIKGKKIAAIQDFSIDMYKKYYKFEKEFTTGKDEHLEAYIKIMSEIPEIKKYIEDIENEIKNDERVKASEALMESQYIKHTSEEKPKKKEDFNDIFYLSSPNKDGSFNAESIQLNYGSGSVYKFSRISIEKANFEIEPRAVKLALRYPNINLDPVCEPLNAYNPNAESILTETPGVARLNGDKWILEKKAKIRYTSEEKTLPETAKEIEELKRIEYLRSIFGDIIQKKKNGDRFFFVEPVVGGSKQIYFENSKDSSQFIVYKFANRFYMYLNQGNTSKENVYFTKEKLGFDEFISSYGKQMFGFDITTKEMRINKLIGYDTGEVKWYSDDTWLYEKVDKLDGHNTLVIPESNTTKVEKFYQGINKLELPDKYEMQDANAVAEWMENNGIEYNKEATLSLYAMSKEEIVELRGKLEALKKDENIAHTFKDVFDILTKRIDWLLRDGDKSYNETRDYYARMAEISTVSESSTTKQLKVKLEEAKEFSPVEKTVGKKPKKRQEKPGYMLIEYPHKLTKEQTHRKIMEFLPQLKRDHSDNIMGYESKWNSNNDEMKFNLTIKIKIGFVSKKFKINDGTVYLDDGQIALEGKLPFGAGQFVEKIKGIITKELEKLLS